MKLPIHVIVVFTGLGVQAIAQQATADIVSDAVAACGGAYSSSQCTSEYLALHDQTRATADASNQAFSDLVASIALQGEDVRRIEKNWETGYHYYNEGRFEEAAPLLNSSCENEHAKACTILGVMYENYYDGEDRLYHAASNYALGCKYDDPQGCTSVGTLVLNSPESNSEDYELARGLFEISCNDGDGRACNNLAVMYATSLGIDENQTLATQLYTISCELGYVSGCDNLKGR